MRASLCLVMILSSLITGCRGEDGQPKIRWKDVEATKAAAETHPSSTELQQEYVDALTTYLRDHPANEEASALFLEAEVEYARALVDTGRFAAAIPYYEDASKRAPQDPVLRQELVEVRSRISVPKERFEGLSRHLTPDEVRDLLGAPRPGWTHRIEKAGQVYLTWYYKRTDDGIASVSFVDDELRFAEYGEPLDLN